MGPASDWYRIVLVVHVFCAIAGFGALMLNAAYAAQGRLRGAREALVIAEAVGAVSSRWARRFIVAAAAAGIALVPMSDHAWGFAQAWVLAALVLMALIVALVLGALPPVEAKVRSLMGELAAGTGGCGGCSGGCEGEGGGEQKSATAVATRTEQIAPEVMRGKAALLRRLEARKAALEGMASLAMVATLVLMVFKPGA